MRVALSVRRDGPRKRPHSQASAETVRRALDTPGELLREDVAAPMERRLGHSFRDVRVHSDAMAATSARALGADAYTIGHDIVFGAGQYQPATPAGQETLAHELSHVVQQRGSSPVAGGMLTVDASATAEDEARRVAAQTRAATGDGIQPVSIGVGSAGTHGTVLQRQASASPPPAAAATQSSITPAFAAGLSDEALTREAQQAYTQLRSLPPRSPLYQALYDNLAALLAEAQKRPAITRGAANLQQPGYGMLRRVLGWKTAGLLDPPFRPDNVPAFAPFPVTPTQAADLRGVSAAALGLGGPLGGLATRPIPPPMGPPAGLSPTGSPVTQAPLAETPLAETPLAETPLAEAPLAEAPLAEAPLAEAPAVGAGPGPGVLLRTAPPLIFLTVMLWSSSTAPAWMDEMNQVTGEPYGSPEDYSWTVRLTQEQQDYLRNLERARRIVPDPAVETDPAPWEVPQAEPHPDDEEEPLPCTHRPIPRRGGHRRHDAYATKCTGSTSDYYVRTPFGLSIAYDGRGRTTDVWEVKVGYGWFFNPQMRSLTDVKLREFDAQMAVGMAVALTCGFFHIWSIPDRWVAQMLNTRWGGIPPVLYLPE